MEIALINRNSTETLNHINYKVDLRKKDNSFSDINKKFC